MNKKVILPDFRGGGVRSVRPCLNPLVVHYLNLYCFINTNRRLLCFKLTSKQGAQCELLRSPYVRRPSSTFFILMTSSPEPLDQYSVNCKGMCLWWSFYKNDQIPGKTLVTMATERKNFKKYCAHKAQALELRYSFLAFFSGPLKRLLE